MKKMLFASALAITTTVVTFAFAEVTPKFDIEGSWIADPSLPLQCTRDGVNVQCVLVNSGFSHSLVGAYIAPDLVVLDVTRRNRVDNCVTHLTTLFRLLSKDTGQSNWVALDSNCDLDAGQSGVDPIFRRVF